MTHWILDETFSSFRKHPNIFVSTSGIGQKNCAALAIVVCCHFLQCLKMTRQNTIQRRNEYNSIQRRNETTLPIRTETRFRCLEFNTFRRRKSHAKLN